MKFIPLIFIVAITSLQPSVLHSQDLQIQRGNKTKTFKTGHLVRIDLPSNFKRDCKTCTQKYIVGRLLSYSNGIISLRIKADIEPIYGNEKQIGESGKIYKAQQEHQWPTVEILSTSTLGITKQGTKKWKSINDGDTYGRFLASTGIILILVGAGAQNEENQDVLVNTGAAIGSAGIIMVAVFNRKTYHTQYDPNFEGNKKTWTLR